VGFFSALQDMAVESYRIEIINENQQGTAASSSYLGYRLGMMVSGVGALYLATIFSWQTAYMVMAALMGVGVMTTFLSSSPPDFIRHPRPISGNSSRLKKGLNTTYGAPLKDLLPTVDWRLVIALIVFYKIGDTTLNVMNIPFLVELGFSKLEIANVAKFFGISAMILGGVIGGLFLNRYGILASLMLCALLQLVTSFMFIVQSLIGCDLHVLIVTIGLENLGCGLGAAAFIAYLSSLCRAPYTATHFALLSSFASLTRIILSVVAGFLADALSWPLFFTCVACASLAFFLLLIYTAPQPYFRFKTAR
jgi:PAT family beta-lactamase induction signal transducer AmpG